MVPVSGDAPPPGSLSVVIPAHDAREWIGEQLEAIRAQDEVWLDEVIVVDSASTDGTAAMVRSRAHEWGKIRLIGEQRPGGNRARNTGARAVSSDAVLCCDADDVVGDGWLRALRAALAGHDLVRGRYELGRLNDAASIDARGSVASTGAPDPSRPIPGLGGNCGFWTVTWRTLGGLAEHHYGSDEEEFFLRAHLRGMKIGYAHDAVVHYRLRSSYRDLYRQQRSWASNRAQLYKEFHESGLVDRRGVLEAARSWAWLVANSGAVRSTEARRRGQWTRVAAANVGRLRGSVRHRVFYP